MDDLEKYKKLLNHESDDLNDELSEFLIKSSEGKLPKGKGKDAIWDEITNEIDIDSKKSIPIWTYLGIAASVVLILSIGFLFKSEAEIAPNLVSHATISAESKIVILPDGSQVMLNANSSIQFSETWNDRKVALKGEAFFEVIEGEKFTVTTNIGTVEVLGTSFNVYARDSTFEVACKTGKVKVDIPRKLLTEPLTPGESIRLELDTVKRSTLTTSLIGKWQAGEFYFSEQRLSHVLQEVERQFNVSVNLPDTSDYIFDGYFTNKNIESALEMVCLPLGLTYEKIGDDTYEIRSLQ